MAYVSGFNYSSDNDIPFGTRLVVVATDRGTPRLAGSATLTVIIVDLNDNSPMIPVPREIRVPEGKHPSGS